MHSPLRKNRNYNVVARDIKRAKTLRPSIGRCVIYELISWEDILMDGNVVTGVIIWWYGAEFWWGEIFSSRYHTYKPPNTRQSWSITTIVNIHFILYILKELDEYLKSINLLFQYDLSFSHNTRLKSVKDPRNTSVVVMIPTDHPPHKFHNTWRIMRKSSG